MDNVSKLPIGAIPELSQEILKSKMNKGLKKNGKNRNKKYIETEDEMLAIAREIGNKVEKEIRDKLSKEAELLRIVNENETLRIAKKEVKRNKLLRLKKEVQVERTLLNNQKKKEISRKRN